MKKIILITVLSVLNFSSAHAMNKLVFGYEDKEVYPWQMQNTSK